MKFMRSLALPLIAVSMFAAPDTRAAEPYQINTILSLSGYLAFVGGTQLKSLKAIEAYVNQHGGIHGRPLSFVVTDDGSSPQTAVQLAQGLIAKNVPVILGSSSPNACGAIAPLVQQNGPVLYCQAGVKFAFSTGNGSNARHVPFHAQLAVAYGLPEDAAIKALTIWPAEIFGADRDIGSIAQGKLANLFIATGDPLDLRSQITEIFIKGREVPPDDRQHRLYDKYKARPQTKITP